MFCRNMESSPPSVSYVLEPSVVCPQRPGIVIVTNLLAYITDLKHALWYSVLFPDSTTGYPMFLTTPLLCTSFLALASYARPETGGVNQTHPEFLPTCHKIAAEISSASQVFFPCAQLIPLTRGSPKLMAHPSRSPVYFRHFALCLFEC